MKAYFNENESLVIEAENQTEAIALKYWLRSVTVEPSPSNPAIPLRHILVKDTK